ncbi:MAG TPA: alkaline phosphatase PhoX [Pyrinomonadaceae bacterium]|nr:alkaline phosphatase PhoX [Pyrinomonadaceae bacterium]
MSKVNRRTFLRRGACAGGALALQGLAARGALEALGGTAAEEAGGYGPLVPSKSRNTGETLLALPEGFEYTVIGRTGSMMSDGRRTPRAHDGMAAFKVGRELRLVRNHEINTGVGTPGAALAEKSYDALAGGGTTTLVIDPKTRELVRSFVSLSGTLINCAGGPTPWGSWISCEETVLGPRRFTNAEGRAFGGFERPHGYCFEVSAAADTAVAPEPLRAMGRFVHEAVAVDPKTKIVYETEDRGAGGFYRFLPDKPGRLAAGGRLQMLAVEGRPGYDTRKGQTAGVVLPVTWVDIERPDPPEAEQDAGAVYKQGVARGGATFARLEGCWYGAGRVYFTSTSGGDKQLGQVWEYETRGGRGGGLLRLLYESAATDTLRMPDNLCVSPRRADCLVVCEDGDGVNHVRCLTPRGHVFDLARNIVPGFEKREFAGATFSPDGQTLFVNIQVPGITFAVWGPWRSGSL